MSRHKTTIPSNYFDALYAGDPDPWRFAASEYEADKYAATLAALPKARYHRALEIGCSIGVFTRELAERCDSLVAVDVARAALDQAIARCGSRPGLTFEQMKVPNAWPDGRFDLLLMSEVVYYLDRGDVARVAERASSCLEPDSDIVLVHWIGETHYPLSGDEAVEAFEASAASFATRTLSTRSAQYRLDAFRVRRST